MRIRPDRIGALLILALFLVSAGVWAQEQPGPEAPQPDVAEASQGYLSTVREQTIALSEGRDDRWGLATASTPRGSLDMRFSVRFLRANDRLDSDGEIDQVIDRIRIADPYGGAGAFLTFDPKAKGTAQLYTFSFRYGVCDAIDLRARFPFQYVESWFELNPTPGTSSLMGIRNDKEIYRFLESLGRPRPVSHYRSKGWELRDMDVGVSINYFRNAYVSLATEASLVFPTGRQADPDEALIYGLGPQVDAGKGSFAPGIAQALDLRGPGVTDFLSLSLQAKYAYFFRGQRQAPRFLEPDPDFVSTLDALGFSFDSFPDLSDLDDHYDVTPASRFDGQALLDWDFKYASFGFGYAYRWDQRPVVQANLEEFEKLLEQYEAYEASALHTAVGWVGVPLFPYGVPVAFGFEARYPLAGHNTARYLDDYQGTLRVVLPF